MTNHPDPRPANLLVIGYGNLRRRDDGVGIRAAEAVAELDLPRVQVLTPKQLVPALAEPISRADLVVFVDANPAVTGVPELRAIESAAPCAILAHAPDPRWLLAWSGQLFGRSPRAWTLAIPVEDLDSGEGLSAYAMTGLRAAVETIQDLARNRLQIPESKAKGP